MSITRFFVRYSLFTTTLFVIHYNTIRYSLQHYSLPTLFVIHYSLQHYSLFTIFSGVPLTSFGSGFPHFRYRSILNARALIRALRDLERASRGVPIPNTKTRPRSGQNGSQTSVTCQYDFPLPPISNIGSVRKAAHCDGQSNVSESRPKPCVGRGNEQSYRRRRTVAPIGKIKTNSPASTLIVTGFFCA